MALPGLDSGLPVWNAECCEFGLHVGWVNCVAVVAAVQMRSACVLLTDSSSLLDVCAHSRRICGAAWIETLALRVAGSVETSV